MASSHCWRCLPRALPTQLTSSLARRTLAPSTPATACFSTSSILHAMPKQQKKGAKGPVKKQAKGHKSKKRPEKTGKPPAPGERKAMRKRIVLSNTNALEVASMRDLDATVVDAMAGRQVEVPADPAPAPQNDEPVVKEEEIIGLETLRAAVAAAGGEAGENSSLVEIPKKAPRGLVPIPMGRDAVGKVLGLAPETVDSLRAVEAFKITQGWGLFRRPGILIREESVKLAEGILKAQEEKSTMRLVLDGKKTSGKSVLLLHAMSTAFVKGWIVMNVPEAQEVTNAMTDYSAIPNTEPTLWSQNNYIANMLTQINKANNKLLDGMTVTQEHTLPVPLQENISLARLCELGARDPEISWPFFLALWKELTAEGRPPIMFCLDGLAHIMRDSLYRAQDFAIIHAHDLAIINHFLSYLSGEKSFPNGGAVLAATSRSHAPVVKSLDLSMAIKRDHQLNAAIEAENKRREEENLTIEDDKLTHTFRKPKPVTQRDPYEKEYDSRAEKILESVPLMYVDGLSKLEARGLMEYWALSGVLRTKVDEQTVGQKWSLAGNGNVGEIQRSALWMGIAP